MPSSSSDPLPSDSLPPDLLPPEPLLCDRLLLGGLASPKEEQSFDALENLVRVVNEHASRQGYAVVLSRTKKSKLKVTRKVWLVCNWGKKFIRPTGQDRCHTCSRRIEFHFSCIGTRENESEIWFLKVVKGTRNHTTTLTSAHLTLRKMAMITEVKSEISQALTMQIAPSKILSSLRIFDPVSGINFDNPESPYIVNSLFKPRDIYHIKA